MQSSHHAEVEKDRQQVVSEFLNSDAQKIFMLIGSELSAIDRNITAAIGGSQNKAFRYEFWSAEHPRHFLFRWLWETVNGETSCSGGHSSDIAHSDPQLAHKLRLLIEEDIRPLEIRFVEALRFIARETPVGQKIVLGFIPRTSLQDALLLEFFQGLLRVLPLNVKMLIGQHNDDILAGQTDFCPSNRLTITSEEGLDGIPEKYRACLDSCSTAGRLLHILATLVHPVGVELLARLTGQGEEALDRVLRSNELEDLVEQAAHEAFRIKYPQALSAISYNAAGYDNPQSLYTQALDYYEGRLSREGADYMDALSHSLSLHHVEDVQVLARHIRSVGIKKLRMGAGDICELEIGRALSLLGNEQDQLKAGLLLQLGEVREARQHNREAMETLDPAIQILKNSERLEDLQLALELMGRAAFGLRDMDASKAAFDESLLAARQLGRDGLTAGLLSQVGYLHFSMKQPDEAETFYRESLELYEKVAQTDEKEGRKGSAAQWSNLGHTSYARADFEAARSFHNRALEIYTALGEIQSSANQWGYLGHTFFAEHSYEKAVEAYEGAAELEEGLGKPEKAAQRYANVGHSMYAQRRVELAKNAFQKAFDKYARLGNPEGQAAQLSNLGMVAGDEGEYESAVDYFNRAAQLYREMRDPVGETNQTVRLAQVYLAGGKYDQAIEQYETALNLYREIGYSVGEADVLLEVGSLFCKKKEWQKGSECFGEAREIFAKNGRREKEALCLMMMAHADKGGARPDSAMAALQQALELYRQDENFLAVANVTSQMGLLQFEQDHFEEAEHLYLEALEVFREKGDTEGEANLLSNLGTLYYSLNEFNKAREYYQNALSLLRTLNHASGIAGLLVNFSFVSEKEGKFDEAGAQLREAKEICEHLDASDQSTMIDQRIAMIEQKASDSLKQMRAELFSPALPKSKTTGKVGANAPCPCGSGKKFKKCCGN